MQQKQKLWELYTPLLESFRWTDSDFSPSPMVVEAVTQKTYSSRCLSPFAS